MITGVVCELREHRHGASSVAIPINNLENAIASSLASSSFRAEVGRDPARLEISTEAYCEVSGLSDSESAAHNPLTSTSPYSAISTMNLFFTRPLSLSFVVRDWIPPTSPESGGIERHPQS